MKTLFILPLLWLLTASTISEKKSYGEIIIDKIPAWQPVPGSGDYKVEIMVPELTSDFISRYNIKVSAKFRGVDGYRTLPYIDIQSASPGIYDYSLAPLKLTITFSPKSQSRADGSVLLPHVQISFN